MFTTQALKLINFFQKAFQAGTIEQDPEKYFAKYRSEIEAAGQVFQYLELAIARQQIGTRLEADKAPARSNCQIRCWSPEDTAEVG